MYRGFAILMGLALVSGVSAAPIIPTIAGHDFNFGAHNTVTDPSMFEYQTNGTAADTLTYYANEMDHEVTAYWPSWPMPPVVPVFDLSGHPNFGGDFVLNVMFTGQDAPYSGPGGTLDVSLVGTGANTEPGAADLEIWGTLGQDDNAPSGLLWALDLDNVALYGYADEDAYVLEGEGTIVGGYVAEMNNLFGQRGAMRGDIDFIDRPVGWLPSEYDPADPMMESVRAAYSGETGLVPEPASLGLLAVGLLVSLRRR